MTEIEKQALALINEVRGTVNARHYDCTRSDVEKALCRAIERHEAFKQEVSDAVEVFIDHTRESCGWGWLNATKAALSRFIIAAPVDPLAKDLRDVRDVFAGADWDDRQAADYFRSLLAARNLEITEKKP